MFPVTNPELLSKIKEWVQGNLSVSYPEHPLVHYVYGDETFRVYDYYGDLTTVAKVPTEDIWGIDGRISKYEKIDPRIVWRETPWWQRVLFGF